MESGLPDIIKAVCFYRGALDERQADMILKKARGRGDLTVKLTHWLEQSEGVFPEPIRAECSEHLTDRGVDVLLEGRHTSVCVGFQIKSNADMKQGFTQKVKAQFTEARAWPNLRLYVIVLACETKHQSFYQHILNESLHGSLQGQDPEVLVLTPGRAAALVELCESPLGKFSQEELLRSRTWSRFFLDVGRLSRMPEFLDTWPQLAPDQRFLPPGEYEEIKVAIADCPLTVLVGPPAIGKTFTAVMLLRRHYRQGKPAAWIEPHGAGLPDHPVPAGSGTAGFREKVQLLCRSLGLPSLGRPRHVHDLIAAQLQADALVLIEDPFGSEDDDSGYSLHTYDFFDLKACVNTISSGALGDCRIILTSRQGLFERWQSECSARGEPLPNMRIVRLSPMSYASRGVSDEPKARLAADLLEAADLAVAQDGKDELARVIADRTETPREIELTVKQLQVADGDPIERVRSVIDLQRAEALTRTQHLCRTASDAERLFLFLLNALKTYGFGVENYEVGFRCAFHALGMD